MAEMDEILSNWGQSSQGQSQPNTQLNWLEGMIGSAVWSAGPGMIGVEPGGNLARWQAENPLSSVGGQFAGMLAPYGAALKVSNRFVPWKKLVDKAASPAQLQRNPFLAGAARETARWAPFEAALVGTGALVGDQVAEATGGQARDFSENALAGAINVGLGAGIGGGLQKLGQVGQAALKRRGVTPGANINALPQVQIRQVREALAAGNVAPEMAELAQGGINRLRRRVLRENPPENRFYNLRDTDLSTQLNNAIAPGQKGRAWNSRKIEDFQGTQAESVLKAVGTLPEDWEAYARFPRVLVPRASKNTQKVRENTEALDKKVKELFSGQSQSLDGKPLRWKALPEEGMFSIAKKTDDGWLTFQTDSPGRFLPEESNWADIIQQNSLKNFAQLEPAVNLAEVPSKLLQYGRKVMADLPVEDFRGLRNESKGIGAGISRGFKILGKEGSQQNINEGLSRVGLFSRTYLAPGDLQFTNNPMANRIRQTAKEMLDQGELLTQNAFLGKVSNSGRNLLRETAFGPAFDDPASLASKIKKISEDRDDWDALLKTIQSGEGIEGGLKNYGLSDNGADILRSLQAIDDELAQSVIGAQKASGIPDNELFKPKAGHFMLSRTWQGNWRTPVYNEKGQMVYVSGGTSRGESQQIAQKIADQNGWTRGDSLTTDLWGDLDMMRKVQVNGSDYRTALRQSANMVRGRSPGTMKQRSGVEGYQVEYTPEELLKSLVQHSRRYRRYEAELSTQALFKSDMEQLALDDRAMAEALKKRLDMMFGKEGEISKAVNKAADTLFAPLIGNQSASRIMGALNSGMYRFSLGFFNVGYNIATLLTFAQTAFPMMSMINTMSHQAPQRLGKYSSYKPIFSEKGAQVMGMLDPMKIAGQAFKELGDADAVLAENMRRAAAEGTTDPRFLDEFVGQNALNKQRLQSVLKSEQPVRDWLRVLADSFPASSERFARGHSFAMGHIFYRDVMGVRDPEQLFRLAKEFTDKTQYLYSQGDRAQLITGPVGSSFGLFKNWVMNYIGWMAAYTGEAFTYNNWKPLLMMMGGTGAVGGVGALPLVGTYNGISKMLGGESAQTQIYEAFNGTAPREEIVGGTADMIYYGLPMALGISVQNTVTAPFHDPTEDAARFFQVATIDQGIKVGRALGSAWDALTDDGVHPATNDEVRRYMAQAFAPKSIYRAVSMMSSDEIISQNTGSVMVGDMSPSERLLHGLSLNPRWVSTRFSFAREMWNDQKAYKERMQSLGKQMADAQANGDRVLMQRIIYAAAADNIPIDSIMKSAANRRSRQDEDIITGQFDEMAQRRLRALNLL